MATRTTGVKIPPATLTAARGLLAKRAQLEKESADYRAQNQGDVGPADDRRAGIDDALALLWEGLLNPESGG